MQSNPLVATILQILRENPNGFSEHQLLTRLALEDSALQSLLGDTTELQLFRKHFLVMNALYTLRPRLMAEGFCLNISPLKIQLQSVLTPFAEGLPDTGGQHALSDYYLDWRHFEQSSSDSVDKLLRTFWQRYFVDDKQQAALAVLQLEASANWTDIRARYRRLAAVHHPDRGGEAEQFRRVQEAYELLACCRGTVRN